MPPPKSSMTAAAASSSLWPVVISFECSPLQLCDLPSLLEHKQQKTLAPCYKCGCCSSSRLTPQASQEPPPITPAEQTQPTSAVAHSSRRQKPTTGGSRSWPHTHCLEDNGSLYRDDLTPTLPTLTK
jgi:hypothetical protein